MTLRQTRVFLGIALFCLALAASTGAVLRYGMVYGMPGWAANFTAVRHAHSHLMYFGWVTLALLALIWRGLPRLTGRTLSRWVPWQMAATALLALISFPAFWANGYGLTQIGPAQLPLGSMVATFNGLTWFWFAWLYIRATRGLADRPLPVQLWDWAIFLLMVASAGAVGLAGLVITGLANIFLQQAFLHLFLDLFAVGWFTLAMLGLLWAQVDPARLPGWLPTQTLAIALAPTFILGMSPTMVTGRLFWPAALANLIGAGLIGVHLFGLWQRRDRLTSLFPFAALYLALHSLIALVLIWPGVWRWAGSTQLRVFFLHNLLLGWTSTALLGLIWAMWGQRGALQTGLGWVWQIGVAAMLLALLGVGFTQFVPIPVPMLYRMAYWASLLVAGAAVGQLFMREEEGEGRRLGE